jgi:carbamoyltransferase
MERKIQFNMQSKKSKKSVILGLNGWMERGHDASACLLINEKIVAFAEEERFTRKRYSYDSLPINAIAYCLEEGKVSIDEINKVVYGWNMPKIYKMRRGKFPFSKKQILKQLFPPNLYKYTSLPPLEFIDHHLAHASSAYRLSGFNDASILVLDGQGEDCSGTLAYSKDGKINIISKVPISFSLGYMMEAACKHIGLRTSDAGKLMGLAGHGKKANIFNNIVLTETGYLVKDFPNDKSIIKDVLDEQEQIIHQWEKYFSDKYPLSIIKESKFSTLKGSWVTEIKYNQDCKNFAYSVQKTLEEVVIHLVKYLVRKTSCRNLVIAGGIGLNCVINGRLISEGVIDNLFVQPAANDAGVSIGAALEIAHKDFGYNKFDRLENIYLGPKYTNQQILNTLRTFKIPYKKVNDIHKLAAKALSEGKIVGWFQGRMEGGPRALGNRSILANPRIKDMHDIVNKIKSRENWRPLAPSILEECINDYFEEACPSPFMLKSHRVKKEKAKEIPAVTHKDLTARYHSVSIQSNKLYYLLIKEFYRLTGIPMIMNTSLNIGGEPLVCTPEQAIKTFYLSAIDYLVLGNYWITKDEKQ